MNNYKIKNSYFDKEIGLSEVTIQFKTGESFTGYALTTPDEVNVSNYFGCALAERRALIKAFKYRIKQINSDYKCLTNLLSEMTQNGRNKRTRDSHYEIDFIKKKIYKLEEEKKEVKDMIEMANKAIDKAIKSRESELDKLYKELERIGQKKIRETK